VREEPRIREQDFGESILNAVQCSAVQVVHKL